MRLLTPGKPPQVPSHVLHSVSMYSAGSLQTGPSQPVLQEHVPSPSLPSLQPQDPSRLQRGHETEQVSPYQLGLHWQ